MEGISSNSQNLIIYPLFGAAVGTLLSKAVVPLDTLQRALLTGGLTTITAIGEQGLRSMLNIKEHLLTKVALTVGISAALFFASLSTYGVSLLGRLSGEITVECFQTLLISSLISSTILALVPRTQPRSTQSKKTPNLPKEKPAAPCSSKFPEKTTVQKTTVQALYGDIMKLPVEAIVNAANEVLLGGGGIDGAIHAKAGPELKEACAKLPILKDSSTDRIKTGDAVITASYNIQKDQSTIKYVVHTAGPRGITPNRKEFLANAYRNSMEVARQNGVKSIAFPAISSGIFGYPFEEAQEVAFKTALEFIEKHPNVFDKVLFSYLTHNKGEIVAIDRAWKKTF